MEKSNEEKAREFANYFAGETDYKESAAYSSAMAMAQLKDEQHKAEKAQWIDEACDIYCKDCEYIGCDKFECLALEKFRKAMEES